MGHLRGKLDLRDAESNCLSKCGIGGDFMFLLPEILVQFENMMSRSLTQKNPFHIVIVS